MQNLSAHLDIALIQMQCFRKGKLQKMNILQKSKFKKKRKLKWQTDNDFHKFIEGHTITYCIILQSLSRQLYDLNIL